MKETRTTTGSDVEYAGWGQRCGAWLVDGLLTWIPLLVFASVAGAILGDPNAPGDATDELVGGAVLLLGSPFVLLYHTLFRGRTPGKRLLGIAAVDGATHERLGYGRAFGRALVTFVLWIPLYVPGLLDGLWPLWNRKRQALHDKMVGTIVVRANAAPVRQRRGERAGGTEIGAALWLRAAAAFVLDLHSGVPLIPVAALVPGGLALAFGVEAPTPLLLSVFGPLAAPFVHRGTSTGEVDD